MPLKGAGYRWVARRRMVSRRKREHRPHAVQELLELRQRISGEEVPVPAEIRKKAMAEVKALRAQAKSQMMEAGQQPQASQAGFAPKDDLAHEVTHNLTPSELRAITNLKLRESLRES